MLNRTIIIARVNKQGKEVYYITFISNFNGPMKKLSVIGILFDQSGNQTLMHVSCCWLGAFLNVEFYRTYLLTSASNTRTLLAKFYAQNYPPTPLQMGKPHYCCRYIGSRVCIVSQLFAVSFLIIKEFWPCAIDILGKLIGVSEFNVRG